jgi:UDPglucose 6-dehydrogenase
VTAYDPNATAHARNRFPTLRYGDSVEQACAVADAVFVLPEWDEFVKLDPSELGDRVRGRAVIDGRRVSTRQNGPTQVGSTGYDS